MKVLFIGGTGTISSAITQKLAQGKVELYLLNRGTRNDQVPLGVKLLTADIHDEMAVRDVLGALTFDVVCDFIGFVPADVERDYRLFQGRTKQFIYISSASAYHKPVKDYCITEGTTMANPYWEYSRNKIACEDYLLKSYRDSGFPVTIVRPSHTYDSRSVPLGVHGHNGSWQVLKRMLEGKPVIIHGDGTSLWTLTHQDDFAVAFIGLMGNPHAIGEVFHITSDESLTWNQIYQIIADALEVTLKPYYCASAFLAEVGGEYGFTGGLIGDKANSVVFDNTKIKRVVPTFKTSIRAEQGIATTIHHILKHKELQREDEVFDKWCDAVIEALEGAKKTVLNR